MSISCFLSNNVIISVMGPRNTGKSTLVEALRLNTGIKVRKFPFKDYVTKILDRKSAETGGFSLGKDLQLYSLISDGLIKTPLILDRGDFFTSSVYGLLDQRISRKVAIEHIEYMTEKFFLRGDPIPVYFIYCEIDECVPGNEIPERMRKDSWDDMKNWKEESDLYKEMVEIFENKVQDRIIRYKNNFEFDALLNIVETLKMILPKNEY